MKKIAAMISFGPASASGDGKRAASMKPPRRASIRTGVGSGQHGERHEEEEKRRAAIVLPAAERGVLDFGRKKFWDFDKVGK